ncbi:MAG: SDR family oxidoreductase, partial [Polyangiaceae bacterium]|nr:SDR family oxidoreductase [Polyangiaceae bacterium]
VLERHGLFTWGDSAQASYERTIDAVTRAERYALGHRRTIRLAPAQPPPELGRAVAPRLRGAFAKLAGEPPERGPIVRLRSGEALRSLLSRPDAADLVARGCMTPDHVLRTKPAALLVREPDYGHPDALATQIEHAVADYARAYDDYFHAMCAAKGVTRKKLDPWPRVVLFPGLGAFAVAGSAREADIALDIYEHTAEVMQTAADVGAYDPCSRADLFDVEYWSLEQAKLKATAALPLSRAVAVVTGAASGIGRATARRFLAAGAHVALVDRDAAGLASAVTAFGNEGKGGRVVSAVADVHDAAAVDAAIAVAVDAWGGVDVVVSNAGVAPEGRLETAEGESQLRESLELNCLAHASVARAAALVFAAQGRGGCLLFNASKSAFNPGPGFGPYAVAKAALVALMRQYAVDLGPRGIRSNAVNADRIRTQLFAHGVAESRAAARNVSVDDYFRANLLVREVTADDVADAFVYLAGARATTGCVVTVDGGNAAAFPR